MNKAYSSFLHIPDLNKIINLPRIELGNWPTPIEKHDLCNGFFIKRDDLSGWGRGGIKTRKLEGAMAYIQKKKFTDIILVVPNISNLRADIELLSAKSNVCFHLILANDPFLSEKERDIPITGNHIRYTVAGRSKFVLGWLVIQKYVYLLFKGKKAACFFPSMAHPSSVMGAAIGMLELSNQFPDMKRDSPKHIFISGCTGTGAAGLILANSILRQNGLPYFNIHVVKVFPIALSRWIRFLLLWTKIKYRLKTDIRHTLIEIHQTKGLRGYGKINDDLVRTCEGVEQQFNNKIDPVYGGRTWLAMKEFIGKKYNGEGIIFWNCGFTPEWKKFK